MTCWVWAKAGVLAVYSIWPAFVLIACALFFAQYLPFSRALDEDAGKDAARSNGLDGLRGFLALGVTIHHAALNYGYLRTGVWEDPADGPFYIMLGQISVALFFMISGFLFWKKMIVEGRDVQWVKLYLGRLLRIGPAYWLAMLVMFGLVFSKTGFQLQVDPGELSVSMAKWFFGFGLFRMPPINGYQQTAFLTAGIIWTLAFEWKYYLSLRLTTYLSGPKIRLPFVAIAWVVCLCLMRKHSLVIADRTSACALFLSGMLAATLPVKQEWMRSRIFSCVAGLCLVAVFMNFQNAYQPWVIVLMAVFFLVISNGNTLCGLLTSLPARRLGLLSYSMYLFHGLVMACLFSWPQAGDFILLDPLHYWLMTSIILGLTIMTALAVYLLVERPSLAKGRAWLTRPS